MSKITSLFDKESKKSNNIGLRSSRAGNLEKNAPP